MSEGMEFRSEYPDVHIPDNITIGQLLLDRYRLHGDAVALVISALDTGNMPTLESAAVPVIVVMTVGAASVRQNGRQDDFYHDSHWCRQNRQLLMPPVMTKLPLWWLPVLVSS